MSEPKSPNLEREIAFENLVSIYFRITLLISGLLMLVGIVLFARHPYAFDFTAITTRVILQEINKLSSVGIMLLGITILLLIPLGRVVILMTYYLSNSDYRMSMVSFTVLIFMLLGMIFNIK